MVYEFVNETLKLGLPKRSPLIENHEKNDTYYRR